MVNFNEVIDSVRPLIFGKVSIREFTRELNIFCKIDQDDTKIVGKLMVDKITGRVNLAYINSKKPEDDKRSIRICKCDHPKMVNLLKTFEEYNKTYGYDPTIKFSSRFINKGED
mgnify:FL=1